MCWRLSGGKHCLGGFRGETSRELGHPEEREREGGGEREGREREGGEGKRERERERERERGRERERVSYVRYVFQTLTFAAVSCDGY